jgi:hypothetical protein
MIPTQNWPKPWLLQVHAAAVEQGFIWLEPISKADAESLKQRFYRVRRRSDKSMAAFIPAEYHLVMMGNWEEGPTGLGRVPVIYNKRPDGVALPTMRAATGEEVEAFASKPQLADVPPIEALVDLTPEALKMDPTEIDSFVDRMARKAKGEPSGDN